MKSRILALAVVVVFFLSLFSFLGRGYADTVIRKDGRKLEGKIIELNEDWVVIETKYGEVTVDLELVAKIIRDEPEEPPEEPEPETGKSTETPDKPKEKPAEKPAEKPKEKPSEKPKSPFERRVKEAKEKGTADAYVELAEWCQDMGLDMEAHKALLTALEIDPENVDARELLGYVRAGGKWMRENEAIKKGYMRGEDGVWKKPDEPKPKKSEKKTSPVDEKKIKEFFKPSAGVPWAGRFTASSKHYEVNCNVSSKAAKTYSKVLEALFKKYMKVFAALKPAFKKRCVVNIHRTYDEFRQAYGAPMGAGGRYEYGRNRIVAFHGYLGGSSLSTFQVLAHEGTHQFQDLFIKGNNTAFPVWIIEGMAVVFESSQIDPDKGTVDLVGLTPIRVKQLQDAIQAGNHVTLQQMLNTPQASFSGSQYNTAGTFTWWLLKDSNNKKYKKLYEKYLLMLVEKAQRVGRSGGGFPADDGSFVKLVDDMLGKSLQDLEQEWQKYVLGL